MGEPAINHQTPSRVKTPWHRSRITKTAVFMAVVLLVISQALSWVGFYFARNALRERVDSHLHAVAAERQACLETFVNQQHERASLVASRTRFRDLVARSAEENKEDQAFRESTQRILLDAKNSTEGCLDIWFANAQGRVTTATNQKDIDRDFSSEEAFLSGREHAFLDVPQHDAVASEGFVSAPAVSRSGDLLGVVIVRTTMAPLQKLLADRTGLGDSGEVIVGTIESDRVRFLLPARSGAKSAAISEVEPLVKAIAGEDGFARASFGDESVLVR